MKYTKEQLMQMAVQVSRESVASGGGPFGAVIARDGEVISVGENRVTVSKDPTAHAEVSAIRQAATRLGTFDLSGCELYTSCEPCPMCLGAIYWAHLDKVYYACTKDDAAAAGFDDSFIYREFALPLSERTLPTEQMDPTEAEQVFKLWCEKLDKTEY